MFALLGRDADFHLHGGRLGHISAWLDVLASDGARRGHGAFVRFFRDFPLKGGCLWDPKIPISGVSACLHTWDGS